MSGGQQPEPEHAPAPTHTTRPIAVGLITGGDIRVEYAQSVMQLWQNDIEADWIVIPSGPYLDVGRNRVVDQFTEMNMARTLGDMTPYHGLLMTDSDIAWTPADVTAIVTYADTFYDTHGVWPVLGGAYLGVMPGGNFVVSYRFEDRNALGAKSMHPITIAEFNDPAAPELIPVDGTGTGFMYIPTQVLEHFREFYDPPAVWFADLIVDGGWFGEDLMFCMRAYDIGHPTLLCRDVRLHHYKIQGLVFPDPVPTPAPEE